MVDCSEVFIGLDVSKDRHAVAVADGGRDGEVRYFGEIGSDGGSVRRFVRKLEGRGVALRFCYEAGPTGYGLQRLIEGLGHDCAVIAPSLIPRRPGERERGPLGRGRSTRSPSPCKGEGQGGGRYGVSPGRSVPFPGTSPAGST